MGVKEIQKMAMDDIRKLERANLKEVADDVRRELAQIRMDVYTAAATNVGKIRGLKKTLARVMTVASEQNKTNETAPATKKAAATSKTVKGKKK